MYIGEITARDSIQIAENHWKTIEAKVFLKEGESEDEAYQKAQGKLHEWFNINAQQNIPNTGNIPTIPARSAKNSIEYLIDDINSNTEIKVLESYKLIAKSRPELQDAYDKKLIELQNKQQ